MCTVVVNDVVLDYHIMGSCVWIEAIICIIVDLIIFYYQMTYCTRIEAKIEIVYAITSYYTPISSVIVKTV